MAEAETSNELKLPEDDNSLEQIYAYNRPSVIYIDPEQLWDALGF